MESQQEEMRVLGALLLYSTVEPSLSYNVLTCMQSVWWCHNRLVSQMRTPLATCREPAGKLWQLCKVLHVFEYKRNIF